MGEKFGIVKIKKWKTRTIPNGVDIYGMPKNDNGYYGIQCKEKDEYVHKSFTEKEIERN